jgi:hypothetical protein
MSEEAIATYIEKNIEGTGTYLLHADRLEVSVRYFMRGTLRASIPLSTFINFSSLIRVHSSVFNLSLWVLVVGVLLLVGVSFVPSPSESLAVHALVDLPFIVGASVALLTARRLTFITIFGCASITIGPGPSGLPGLQAFVAQVLATRAANDAAVA